MIPINIILENSTHAQNYSTNSDKQNYSTLIHNKEFDKVIQIIKDSIPIDQASAANKNLHNTITILGSRGSGKTSFLLSIKFYLESSERYSIGKDIQVLNIIDPTLIEEKGHVFLNVISRITDLIEKKLDQDECNISNENLFASRKTWRQALNKLAAGLPSIDGIGNNSNEGWQDPEFVMENGLKAVDSSLKLGDNFNFFLKEALKILNKKAFILMFDDIDVDSRKGWAVLETIRKYFTGAQLITIISGDLKLYSSVVRQKKWQNFGNEILKYEAEGLNKISVFNDVVTQLESQYLQKILQPKFRIHLPTIYDICQKRDRSIFIYKNENEGILIDQAYGNILGLLGIKNEYQASAYLNFLLALPIRTQIQILSIFYLDQDNRTVSNEQILLLIDVFISDLYDKEIDPESLKLNSNLNRIVLQFLLKEQRLEELYQLQPITTDSSLNSVLLSLNFSLTNKIQNDPFVIFDYFIRIGYIRNLVPILGYSNENRAVFDPSFKELCEKDIILSDRVLKDIIGKVTAYIRGYTDKNPNSENISIAGTIPIFGMADKAKRNRQATSDRIDSVLKAENATFIEKLLVYIPLSSNQYTYKQTSLLTYSPYLLFGAIGELCRKFDLEDLKNGFSELSQLRAYMMPDFKRGNNEDYDISEETNFEFPERTDTDTKIEELFEKWARNYPKNNSVSVHLLGKIVTRYFYALSNIENKMNKKSLGEIFHAQLIAFMNAVLIEDCRENSNFASELNINNTNYSNKIFINNLKTILKKDFSELTFSKWILSCPLLLVYLKNDDNQSSNYNTSENTLNNEDTKQQGTEIIKESSNSDDNQNITSNLSDSTILEGKKQEKNNENNLTSLIVKYCTPFTDESIFKLKIYNILHKIKTRTNEESSKINLVKFDRNNYEEVSKILQENNISLDSLKTLSLKDLKKQLKEVGIEITTRSSLNAYSNKYK
ncbi:hypothetical protein EG344_18490 [Chryseobacterium sp. G0162]|uniref:hypothetical protein n=1 Tax=Chryseobacterium sp. G0162 TaxID=2487063 RepID=UPI000F517060|nr:hypothetical protein [Chryseobacterium sp. G0162]AZB10681.1 hypothetical protein EG344_18490 [Chryseobacterium sp. G0162]